MAPAELLARLKDVLTKFPTPESWKQNSHVAQDIMAEGHALLRYYDNGTMVTYKVQLQTFQDGMLLASSLNSLRMTLATAVADLTLKVDPVKSQVFGPGAVYDFYREFRKMLSTAKQEIFFVDPYINDEIFDVYIGPLEQHLRCRMLINSDKSSKNIPAIAGKVRAQRGAKFDIHSGTVAQIHDRIVFVDDAACWVVGQSVKDAAVNKPTYLAPLSADVVPEKRKYYEAVWAATAQIG